MDDKGDIISSAEIDKNLALAIWAKDASPRLVIENKSKKGGKKKLIRLNWLERSDRKLTISGSKMGQSFNYEMKDLDAPVKKMLNEYATYSKFKSFYWKTITILGNMIHTPTNIIDPAEFGLMPEKKRFFLWLGDMTESRDEGFYVPFMPLSDEEKALIPSEDGVPFTDDVKGLACIQKYGLLRKLMGTNHSRWYRPLQISAAAMLLNFSFCGDDGSELSEALWDPAPSEPLALRPDDSRLAKFGERLNLYIRHYDAIPKIGYEEGVYESVTELQKREYVRKRRFSIPMGSIGDVEYTVTLFEKEGEPIAVSCAPQALTVRHEHDMIFHIPEAVLTKAGKDDAIRGSLPDELYSLSSLIKAKQFYDWSERIAYFISDFAGVKPNKSN